jgi:hypothetical protein
MTDPVAIEDIRKAKAFKLLSDELLRRFKELGLDGDDLRFFCKAMIEHLDAERKNI